MVGYRGRRDDTIVGQGHENGTQDANKVNNADGG